jgi:putative ABC transport system ATP-binding protein
MKPMAQTLRLRLPFLSAPLAARGGAARADNGRLEPTIYRFIVRYSLKDQLVQMAVTAASLPFYYASLDLPKTIVNRAIAGKNIPEDVFGVPVSQVAYLLWLCFLFLVLVIVNQAFKYAINLLSGRTGERMLRRLRYLLYERMIRFPLGHFKKVSVSEMIPMITAEVEPLGGFIGEAFTLPAFQGGQLLTLLYFMFVQDWKLGLAAIALYPMQGYVIPRLQRKVNQLGKQRVKTVRVLADRVGESAAGMVELRSNDAARFQLAHVAHLLGTIYDIRFEIYQRKFFVKFLNNFINQLTPFFFFSIGGYLVITGGLSFGALVAVLAAYKDLASPWKELLDFYQRKEDTRIKYEQIVEQFQPDGLIADRLLLEEPEIIPPLRGEVNFSNVSLVEDERVRLLDGISLTFPITEHVAVVGIAGSGKSEFGAVLARLTPPTAGRVTVGGVDVAVMPLAVLGRRLGYAAATPHLFAGSLRDNLHFPLKTRPTRPPEYEPPRARKRQAAIEEARRSGNIDLDIEADWIDYELAGVKDQAELTARVVRLLRVVGLDEDVYGFGLRGRISPKQHPEVAERLLEARAALRERLAAQRMTQLVELFDPARYNGNATLAENLLFGTPTGTAFDFDTLATNTYVLGVLDKVGLTADLVAMGQQVAKEMVELFADLPADHEFFEQYSFISAGDLPEFQAILGRVSKAGPGELGAEDRARLLSLPFKLIVARHRLGLIDEAMQARILEARHVFAADMPDDLRGQIEFFDPARYNAAATLQDNVLFGKIAYGEADAPTSVPAAITAVLDSLGLRETVIAVGLDHGVGTGGTRLSLAQRQKAAIVRALLKRPDILVLNEATTALDGPSQAMLLAAMKEEYAGRGVVWVLHRASLARHFDRVVVMSEGRVVQQGRYDELAQQPDSVLGKLVQAE